MENIQEDSNQTTSSASNSRTNVFPTLMTEDEIQKEQYSNAALRCEHIMGEDRINLKHKGTLMNLISDHEKTTMKQDLELLTKIMEKPVNHEGAIMDKRYLRWLTAYISHVRKYVNESEEESDRRKKRKEKEALKATKKSNAINKEATTSTATSEIDESNKNATDKTKLLKRGRKTKSVVKLKPCDCSLCGETFDSDRTLGYHIRDVHVVGEKEKKDEEVPRRKKPRDYYYPRGKDRKLLNPKRIHICSICNSRFLYESSLKHHKFVVHNEKTDVAGGDDDNNSSAANSTRGPPKMYDHTYQCDQCGKILKSKGSLYRHLVTFHGTDHEKPFQCDICGQRYVCVSALVSHRRREHTGDKPYVCEQCGKAFTMADRLKLHMRVHSDEKFYKCPHCSKEFKAYSAFRSHKDIHLGVMRHTCKYCERKFLFQGNMVKHIRRVHPNGEKAKGIFTGGRKTGASVVEGGLTPHANINSIDTIRNNNNNVTSKSNNNIPIVPVTSTSVNIGPSLTANHTYSSSETFPPIITTNSIAPIPSNNISRRANNHRYQKTIQTPDHSYFIKDATLNVNHHAHLLEPQQQQQNTQCLSLMEQFQPEIQFQVLPPSLISNQELFNGMNTYSSANTVTSTQGNSGMHQSQTINSNHHRESRVDFPPHSSAGKCRLCDQSFPDIRFHITDFHRIAIQKVESLLPTMVYF